VRLHKKLDYEYPNMNPWGKEEEENMAAQMRLKFVVKGY
jgi:hypothetical protein